jgi:DNA-binding response OmpR family regulator
MMRRRLEDAQVGLKSRVHVKRHNIQKGYPLPCQGRIDILDLNLPDMNGPDTLKEIREWSKRGYCPLGKEF